MGENKKASVIMDASFGGMVKSYSRTTDHAKWKALTKQNTLRLCSF